MGFDMVKHPHPRNASNSDTSLPDTFEDACGITPNFCTAIISYSHTPIVMLATIALIKQVIRKRRWLIKRTSIEILRITDGVD